MTEAEIRSTAEEQMAVRVHRLITARVARLHAAGEHATANELAETGAQIMGQEIERRKAE